LSNSNTENIGIKQYTLVEKNVPSSGFSVFLWGGSIY